VGAARAALIEELAREIVADGRRRVAVDGFDGAGKTHLADELATAIGPVAVRVRVDDFLNPQAVRYARGRDSPEGFFLDSFDYDAFRAALTGELVIADGIFLHRDALVALWDWSIWLDVPFAVSIPRGAARGPGFGDADPAAPSNRRYVEGQRLYVSSCSPRERATVVIDNTDLDAPRRVLRP
jgi:uridine kinase